MKKFISLITTLLLIILVFISWSLPARAKENSTPEPIAIDEGTIIETNDTVNATYKTDYAFDVLDIVNQERINAGLSPLTMDIDLYNAAAIRAEEITRSFSHTRPNNTSCFTASDKMYGENIAKGYSSSTSVMNVWMNSPDHKSNILEATYVSIGISCYEYGGRLYWVQCFGIYDVNEMSRPNDTTNVPTDNSNPSGVVINPSDPSVSYITHIQTYAWNQDWISNGLTAGTVGYGKRLEAIKIKLTNTDSYDLGVKYKTHIQSHGWETNWTSNEQISGTSGQSKRLEAIKIELTGADRNKFDIYYRVHAQTYGWLGWAKNGEAAGTAGQAKRLEAIQIAVLPKGTTPSNGIIGYSYIEYGKTAKNTGNEGLINYTTHVQTYGDQSYVYDGSVSGTLGEAKRLEGIKIQLGNTGYSGSVTYSTHIQTYAWNQGYVSNNALSGTKGEAKRLEAISIKLTGEVSNHYDVYYRVHAQTYGWLGWAKNGTYAGTSGLSKRLEGIQIVLLPKGSPPPTSNNEASYISN